MSQYQVVTRVCDDLGANCSLDVYIASTDLPISTGFGVLPGSAEFWQIVTAYAVLMATVWALKSVVHFIRGR